MLWLYCVINCIISSDYTDSAVVYLKLWFLILRNNSNFYIFNFQVLYCQIHIKVRTYYRNSTRDNTVVKKTDIITYMIVSRQNWLNKQFYRYLLNYREHKRSFFNERMIFLLQISSIRHNIKMYQCFILLSSFIWKVYIALFIASVDFFTNGVLW